MHEWERESGYRGAAVRPEQVETPLCQGVGACGREPPYSKPPINSLTSSTGQYLCPLGPLHAPKAPEYGVSE